jgi:hypothetical protein
MDNLLVVEDVVDCDSTRLSVDQEQPASAVVVHQSISLDLLRRMLSSLSAIPPYLLTATMASNRLLDQLITPYIFRNLIRDLDSAEVFKWMRKSPIVWKELIVRRFLTVTGKHSDLSTYYPFSSIFVSVDTFAEVVAFTRSNLPREFNYHRSCVLGADKNDIRSARVSFSSTTGLTNPSNQPSPLALTASSANSNTLLSPYAAAFENPVQPPRPGEALASVHSSDRAPWLPPPSTSSSVTGGQAFSLNSFWVSLQRPDVSCCSSFRRGCQRLYMWMTYFSLFHIWYLVEGVVHLVVFIEGLSSIVSSAGLRSIFRAVIALLGVWYNLSPLLVPSKVHVRRIPFLCCFTRSKRIVSDAAYVFLKSSTLEQKETPDTNSLSGPSTMESISAKWFASNSVGSTTDTRPRRNSVTSTRAVGASVEQLGETIWMHPMNADPNDENESASLALTDAPPVPIVSFADGLFHFFSSGITPSPLLRLNKPHASELGAKPVALDFRVPLSDQLNNCILVHLLVGIFYLFFDFSLVLPGVCQGPTCDITWTFVVQWVPPHFQLLLAWKDLLAVFGFFMALFIWILIQPLVWTFGEDPKSSCSLLSPFQQFSHWLYSLLLPQLSIAAHSTATRSVLLCSCLLGRWPSFEEVWRFSFLSFSCHSASTDTATTPAGDAPVRDVHTRHPWTDLRRNERLSASVNRLVTFLQKERGQSKNASSIPPSPAIRTASSLSVAMPPSPAVHPERPRDSDEHDLMFENPADNAALDYVLTNLESLFVGNVFTASLSQNPLFGLAIARQLD